MEEQDRKCNNCSYRPCGREECKKNGSCIFQKFPHEVAIEEFLKEYYEKNPEGKG